VATSIEDKEVTIPTIASLVEADKLPPVKSLEAGDVAVAITAEDKDHETTRTEFHQ